MKICPIASYTVCAKVDSNFCPMLAKSSNKSQRLLKCCHIWSHCAPHCLTRIRQRTLAVGGSITARIVSSFTSLDSTASLGRYSQIKKIVKSSLVKLETSHAMILPPIVSVLCIVFLKGHSRPLFFIVVFSIQLTVNVQYNFLPMTGFELRIS